MGRKKIKTENQKKHLSVVVSPENFNRVKDLDLNESKFINWLLEEHFNKLENGGK